MYIKERNGKFRYFQSYKDPLTERKKTVSVTLDSKSRAAQKRARTILTEKINQNLNRNDEDITARFGDYLPEWLEYKRKRVSPSTYRTLIIKCNVIKKMIPADALLKNINPQFLKKKFDDLLYDQNYSNGYVKEVKTTLFSFFEWLIESGIINNNPLEKVKIDYKKDELSNADNKFLEDDELEKVLNDLPPFYSIFCEWLYLTGMRAGEAEALNFDDVVIEDGTYFCNVNKTVIYTENGQEVSDTPKTIAGIRKIELPTKAVKIYNKQKEKYKSGLIFRNKNNNMITTQLLNLSLKRCKKRLGIKKRLSSHIFRHTHISKLAELGVPLYLIQKRVGHGNSNITRDIYLHVTKKAEKQLTKKLDFL